MALGLPTVASDIPAVREVVDDGVSADLVPPGDSQALAVALAEILSDPDRRRAYGERARETFQQRFRADDAIARLIDLLDAVARPDGER